MKAPSPLLQQCFDEVIKDAPKLLTRCLDAVIVILLQTKKPNQEVVVADRRSLAWSSLMRLKPVWSQAYPHKLREVFASGDTEAASSRMGLLGDSKLMALVDDAELNEMLETKRLQQKLLAEVEKELAVLDARISSLIGLDTVHAEKNPLRPTVFIQVLRDLMAAGESDAEVRTIWLQNLAEPLAAELRPLYERLALMLQRANVQEASYRVRLLAEAPSARETREIEAALDTSMGLIEDLFPLPGEDPDAADAEPDLLPAMAELARARSQVEHGLYQQFLSEGGEAFDRELAPDFYREIAKERAVLREQARQPRMGESELQRLREQHREVSAVDRPVRAIDTDTQLSQQAWGEYATPQARSGVLLDLKEQAQRTAQALGLDVVRMLVNQVARDPLLLAPVREAIVALEPALLRLALPNPRYFNEPDHPARRLVETVAQRSFRFNDEFSPDFLAFFQPVADAFKALNALATDNPRFFEGVLDDLQQGWQSADEQEQRLREESLRAVRYAEERQALADRIAHEISQRPDAENAPAFLLEFLYGPWSLVIASAQLNSPEGAIDPGGYRKAVSHLLWSIRKEVTLRLPAQLFQIVPGLIQTLRAGLDMLGQTPDETRPFFDALMRLHEPVLGLRRARKRVEASASGSMPLTPEPVAEDIAEFEPATPEQRVPRQAEQPWLGQHELEAAGFEETRPSEDPDLLDRPPSVFDVLVDETPREVDSVLDPTGVLAMLRVGDWVDLYSHREWLRAELVWSSANGALFMFISLGGRAHSMTRRSCERLITDRLLRPVGATRVVQRALDAVAEPRSRLPETEEA